MPEFMASSTPYWMRGLSTRGSISFGWALVAGRNRVPSPAAGKTALRTLGIIRTIVSEREDCEKLGSREDQLPSPGRQRAGVFLKIGEQLSGRQLKRIIGKTERRDVLEPEAGVHRKSF